MTFGWMLFTLAANLIAFCAWGFYDMRRSSRELDRELELERLRREELTREDLRALAQRKLAGTVLACLVWFVGKRVVL